MGASKEFKCYLGIKLINEVQELYKEHYKILFNIIDNS